MTDPAIKAALAAAVDASFRHDGDGFPPPLHVRRERHWRVTHEIAAFFRALPGARPKNAPQGPFTCVANPSRGPSSPAVIVIRYAAEEGA